MTDQEKLDWLTRAMAHVAEVVRSPATPKLNLALSKAQGAMEAAKRDAKNPAFMREGKPSTYATLAAVIDAIRDPFSLNELAHFQATLCDDATVSVTTFLLHSSGEERASTFKVPVVKRDPQGFASATTYARRVGLMAAAGIAPDDDDDGNSHSTDAKVRDVKTAPKPVALTEDKIAQWVRAFGDAGVDVAALEAKVGHAVSLLTRDDLPTLKTFLAEKKPTTDPDELNRRAVQKQAEEAFRSAQASLASPVAKPSTVEANATFRALAERISAAPSEAEALLIQAEAVRLSLPKSDMAALGRAVKDRAFILSELRKGPAPKPAADVPF